MTVYRIDGEGVGGIADLFTAFNREFMRDEDWQMGESLDALDDVLHRLESETRGGDPAVVIWEAHRHSREALGYEETQRWLLRKLAHPSAYDEARIMSELDDLRSGTGRTYFHRVIAVFADHPLVDLQLH